MKKAFCALAVCVLASLSMGGTALAHGNSAQTCNGTFTGATFGNLVVPKDGVCILIASTVNGSVTVKERAYFEANGTSIAGSVTSSRADTIFIHNLSTVGRGVSALRTENVFLFDSTVTRKSIYVAGTPERINICGMDIQSGNVDVEYNAGDILLGDPVLSGCAGNNVNGDVAVLKNFVTVGLVVSGNTITGDLEVSHNKGSAQKLVEGNIGGEELECKRNQQPFTAAANLNWEEKEGQCAGP